MGRSLRDEAQRGGHLSGDEKKAHGSSINEASDRPCTEFGWVSRKARASNSQEEGERRWKGGRQARHRSSEVSSFGKAGEALHDHTPKVHVPGADATTINPGSLWKALPRLLLDGSNSLQRFYRSQLSSPTFVKDGSTSTQRPDDVWPMRLPFGKSRRQSGKVDADDDDSRLAVENGLDLCVACLNWLHLGRPSVAPGEIRGPGPLSGVQRAVVSRLEKWLRVIVLHPPVDAAAMGRVAAKVEGLERLVVKLTRQADRVVPYIRGYRLAGGQAGPLFDPGEVDFAADLSKEISGFINAKPIVASRITFGPEPKFDPLPYMDATCRERYFRPLSHSIPEADCQERAPRARILASRCEKMALLHKLDEAGRLSLIPASIAREKYLNGLFFSAKRFG